MCSPSAILVDFHESWTIGQPLHLPLHPPRCCNKPQNFHKSISTNFQKKNLETHINLHDTNTFESFKMWCISSNFGHQVVLHALVVNLASRWRFLYCLYMWPTVGYKFSHQCKWRHLDWIGLWPPGGATCNGYKFSHQWRHLHWFGLWPPGGATCNGYKFSHQVALLA